MRIKIDEDLPNQVIRMLRDRGYSVMGVVEQGMGGWIDPALWEVIQTEKRLLITADKGFADIRIHPPGTHAGVLLLRPDEDGIKPVISLMERVLLGFNLEDLSGTITVVNPRGVRVRRPYS